MNRLITQIITLLVMVLLLASCQSDVDLQAPAPSGDTDLPVFSPEDKTATEVVDYSQSTLEEIFASQEPVPLVTVDHSYLFLEGETFSFVPPGYAKSTDIANQYLCTVTVPAGALMDEAVVKADIALDIQAADYQRTDADAANPVTTFALRTNQPGGLHFAVPVSVTICKHPLATTPDPEVGYRLVLVERQSTAIGDIYVAHDIQLAAVDHVTGAFTLQVTYIPYGGGEGDKDGDGDSDHWGNPKCVPYPCP